MHSEPEEVPTSCGSGLMQALFITGGSGLSPACCSSQKGMAGLNLGVKAVFSRGSFSKGTTAGSAERVIPSDRAVRSLNLPLRMLAEGVESNHWNSVLMGNG